jgi:hypothetical protein
MLPLRPRLPGFVSLVTSFPFGSPLGSSASAEILTVHFSLDARRPALRHDDARTLPLVLDSIEPEILKISH